MVLNEIVNKLKILGMYIGTNNIRLRIARSWGVRIGDNCRLFACHFGSEPYLISIGNHCEITYGVIFITHDGGTWIFRENNSFNGSKFGQIVIKDNCMIGLNSIILPNVEIGPNSVVGAGSVVTKNVLPNSVYAGNPAKYICSIDEYLQKCKINKANEIPYYMPPDYKKEHLSNIYNSNIYNPHIK